MLNSGVSLQRLATKAGVGFTPKKLFSNGEAGVWYDPSDVEASLTWRRNLLEYTESLDNSYYDHLGGLTVTANAGVAPDGSQTADRLNFTNNNLSRLEKAFPNGLANTSVVYSVWMRTESGSVSLDLGHQGTGKTNVTVTTEWQRFTHTFIDADGSFYPRVQNDEAVAKSVLSWGWQIEYANEATEYQPIRTTFDNAFKQAFPKHTLYQDERGLVPVTGLGQAVGLMLDKSEGVAFGDEEVTNGGFDSASNWTISAADAASNISNGVAYVESAGSNAYMTQQLTGVTAGKTYVIKFNYINAQGTGLAYVRFASTDLAPVGSYGVGRNSYIFTAGSGSQELRFMTYATVGASFTIDDVSVKEVKGSHATQSDSTKRPVFARHPERGRVNLLKYTEEFDNGFWGKSDATVIPNAIQSPTGESTADKIFDSGLASWSGVHLPNAGVTVTSGKTYTFSVFVKNAGLNWVQIGGSTPAFAGTYANVNLTTGEAGNSNTSVSVSDVGNGWFRVIISAVCIQTHANGSFFVAMYNSDVGSRLPTFSGQGSDGLYIWGAQLEEANEATGYQKVVDDYDITESGYKSVYYLQFDGVNDGMLINNLTSGNTPVTALFGYSANNVGSTRKYLFDIETGRTVLAASTEVAEQIGYYDGAWRGFDTDAFAIKVLTYDLVEDDAKIRIDGIQEYSDTTYGQQAIGGEIRLFTSYGTDLRCLEGNMYQTILRAAESTDEEIAKAETFVANKTGLKAQVDGIATLDLNFGANTYTARNSNGSVL